MDKCAFAYGILMVYIKNFKLNRQIQMFNPSLQDVRNFFFDAYAKGTAGQQLTDLEKIAFSIIIEHPEYRQVLENREKFLAYNWLPESGETNPFLHLSMHMSIHEQLTINQPFGVKELYYELCQNFQDEHEVQHIVMDCLGEMIWQAQYSGNQPDPSIYLKCLQGKLGRSEG